MKNIKSGAFYFTSKEERVILMNNGIRPIQGKSALGKFWTVKVLRSKELKLSFRIEKRNHHVQLTSFCVSFLDSSQFFASTCDFCRSSFPLGCLGLNCRVAVYSRRKVDRRFDVQNATFRWRFFYILFS